MGFNFEFTRPTDQPPELSFDEEEEMGRVAAWLDKVDDTGLADRLRALEHRQPFVETVYKANYTFNVAPMWYKAFYLLDSEGEPAGIRGLHGLSGAEGVEALRAAIAYMEEHQAEMEVMRPANGWGSYSGALRLLREMLHHTQGYVARLLGAPRDVPA